MANATTYTLNLPSNGVVGTPLEIVATPGTGGPEGKVNVTFSDGGAGGTFTPATVEFEANDATSKTAEYTPVAASAGKAVTVSATNDSAMTNPEPFVVNVEKLPFATVDAQNPEEVSFGTNAVLKFTPGDGVAHTDDLLITLTSDTGVLSSKGELVIPKGTTAPAEIEFTPTEAGTATIEVAYPNGVAGPIELSVVTKPVAPSVPKVTLAAAADGVHVTVEAPSSSGGAPIEEYRIYGGTAPGKENQKLLVTLKDAGEVVIKNVPFESAEYVNVEVSNSGATTVVPEQSIVVVAPAPNTPEELVDVAILVNAYAKAAQGTDHAATAKAHYDLVFYILHRQSDDVVDFAWNYFSGKSGVYLPTDSEIGLTLIPPAQAVLVREFENYMTCFRSGGTVPYDPNRFTRQGINAFQMLNRFLYITNNRYGRNA